MPLYLTEYGYQTRPDPIHISFAQQAAFLNQAEYIASRNPSVRTLSQFLLVDDKPDPAFSTRTQSRLAWRTFQSGLDAAGRQAQARLQGLHDAAVPQDAAGAPRPGGPTVRHAARREREHAPGGLAAVAPARLDALAHASHAPRQRAAALLQRAHDGPRARASCGCAGSTGARRSRAARLASPSFAEVVLPRAAGAGPSYRVPASGCGASAPVSTSSTGRPPGPPRSQTLTSSCSYSSVTASQE